VVTTLYKLRREASSKVKETQELSIAKRTSLIRHLEHLINLKKIWKNNMLRKETWLWVK